MSKVWLVTGSGSGLGRAIAEAALEEGNRVVATARDTEQLNILAESPSSKVVGRYQPVALDALLHR